MTRFTRWIVPPVRDRVRSETALTREDNQARRCTVGSRVAIGNALSDNCDWQAGDAVVATTRRWRKLIAQCKPRALDRLANPKTESFQELWNRLRIDLEPISLSERAKGFRRSHPRAAQCYELSEVLLKPCRRDDLQNPRRLIAGVPERMPLVARLENEISGTALNHRFSEQRANAPFEHVAVLIFTSMPMQRSADRARRHRVFDQRESATGLSAVDHEADSHAPEKAGVAVACTENFGHRGIHCRECIGQRSKYGGPTFLTVEFDGVDDGKDWWDQDDFAEFEVPASRLRP